MSSKETPPHHDLWDTTERMQRTAREKRARFTLPRARTPGRPAIDSPLQRSPDFARLGDRVGAHA